MKKNVLNTLLAAALLLLAGACGEDELAVHDNGNGRTVAFTVQLPDAPLGRAALGDGTTATKLSYAVYEKVENDGKALRLSSLDEDAKEVEFTGKTATLELPLLIGRRYDIVFWADAYGKDAADAPYTLDFGANAASLQIDYGKVQANGDRGDAFYAVKAGFEAGSADTQVNLLRPFAQLNIGTDDKAAAGQLGLDVDGMQTSVTVEGLHTGLDLLDGTLLPATVDATFARASLPEGAYPVQGYDYLSLDYLLAGTDRSLHGCTLTVYEGAASATPYRSVDFGQIPVRRNYRTNVYGSLLTTDNRFTVKVDNSFEDAYDNPHAVASLEELGEVFAAGGTAILADDIVLDSDPLKVPAGTTVTVDLNGHTIINTGSIYVGKDWSIFSADGEGAVLTLKGEGTVRAKAGDCYVADVRNGGKLVIESGNYVGNLSAVYCYEGEVEVKGGTFSIQQLSTDYKDYRFLFNCQDKNYTSGTAKITITGGTFVGFNPADNLAEGAGTDFTPKTGRYASLKVGEDPAGYGTWEVRPYTNDAAGLQGLIDSGASVVYFPTTVSLSDERAVLDSKGRDVVIQGSPLYLNATDVTLKGLVFDNGHSESKQGSCIYATANKCRNLVFEGCTFTNAEWDAVQLTDRDVESVVFKGCTFRNTVQGYRYVHLELIKDGSITVNETASLAITGCTFENVSGDYCKDSAITVAGFRLANLTLEGNTVKGAGADAIDGNIIWICDGNNFNNTIPAETLKEYFVYSE